MINATLEPTEDQKEQTKTIIHCQSIIVLIRNNIGCNEWKLRLTNRRAWPKRCRSKRILVSIIFFCVCTVVVVTNSIQVLWNVKSTLYLILSLKVEVRNAKVNNYYRINNRNRATSQVLNNRQPSKTLYIETPPVGNIGLEPKSYWGNI